MFEMRPVVIGSTLLAVTVAVGAAGVLCGPAPGEANEAFVGTEASTREPLLQFRSQGHLVGFTEGRMYTVGMGYALVEEFVGAHPVRPQASPPAPPAEGGGVSPLQSVTYRHLWDGITASYSTSPAGLAQSTYRLEPHADSRRIRLRYNTGVALQPDGSLRVQRAAAKGYFTLSAPKAWQELGGRRVAVSVAFTESEEGVVGFAVGAYDPAEPLLIDPTYAWHTFQGSSLDDHGEDIAIDGDGNVYVTGTSDAGWGAPLNPHSGGGATDLVVMKFDSAGALLWHTFYGSNGSDDAGRGIAVDGGGNVYVTGFSAAPWGMPLEAHGGFDSSVVLKLDGAGALEWHTFHGSPDPGDYGTGEYGLDIAVDGAGDVYVTGFSYASWDGPAGEPPLNPHSGIWNLVVLKLTGAGAYQWHTYYGSTSVPNSAEGRGIAVDGGGNVYVTGESWFGWSGPGGELPRHAFGGRSGTWNLVVLKLTSAGAYQWHTFYDAEARGIAEDGSGNVFATGFSSATWGTPLHPHSGDRDVVVMKFDSAGALQWHTFYGSAGADEGRGIAVDGSGNVYVTGESWATWGTPLHAFSGSAGFNDLVVLELDGAGALQWHAFYGSGSFDYGSDIAVDNSGSVHAAGMSWVSWGTPLDPHAGITGNADIVVLKLVGDVDPDPDPFTFVDVIGVSVSTPQVSNSITVAGIAGPASVSVSGDASSEYAVNGGGWTSASGSVNTGDTVQVRHTSAASYGASVATTLTIGGVSDTFTSTTAITVVGDLTIVGTAATLIDMGGLTSVGGNLEVSGNTAATLIDMTSLTTVGGDLGVSGNTSATLIDMGSLTTVGGDLEVSGNTSATVIDMGSLTTVGGNLEVSSNTAATLIDMGSLTTVGGDLEVSGNTSATSIDMSSTATVSGDLIVANNGGAAVNMSSGTDVGGNLTIETSGTGSFSMGDGTVTGDLTLDATGYTGVSGTTPGGALDLTAANPGALMHVQVQAESFTTPVTFTVTRLDPTTLVSESGLDADGAPATIDPVAAHRFTFAIPTLDREATLSFDIDVAGLDEATRTAFLDALAAGAATLVTKGDAVDSVYQAFPICEGTDAPAVDGCVKVEALDADGQPTTGTPALVLFSNVIGHFSSWGVAIVTSAPPPYTLTVTTDGTGAGFVTSGPAGIACPTDCTESYAAHAVVTLTATPNSESTFTGWGGDCASFLAAPTCTLTMTGSASVVATFTPTSVGPDLTGTVSDQSSRCYLSLCSVAWQMTLRNEGTAPSGPFRVRYFLSADPTLDRTDTRLWGTEWVNPGLSAGATRTRFTFVPWPVPSRLVRGHLLAVIDARQEVAETDETNNVLVLRMP